MGIRVTILKLRNWGSATSTPQAKCMRMCPGLVLHSFMCYLTIMIWTAMHSAVQVTMEHFYHSLTYLSWNIRLDVTFLMSSWCANWVSNVDNLTILGCWFFWGSVDVHHEITMLWSTTLKLTIKEGNWYRLWQLVAWNRTMACKTHHP